MKISVAMCTYNGALYIQEQLTSILSQTRKVDEIVICDDGSKDETLEIIQHTAQSSSIKIQIIQNKKNLAFLRISCRLFLSVQEILSSYPIKMMSGERTR